MTVPDLYRVEHIANSHAISINKDIDRAAQMAVARVSHFIVPVHTSASHSACKTFHVQVADHGFTEL